jgi:hypothetical protein
MMMMMMMMTIDADADATTPVRMKETSCLQLSLVEKLYHPSPFPTTKSFVSQLMPVFTRAVRQLNDNGKFG